MDIYLVGGAVSVRGLGRTSLQGDASFVDPHTVQVFSDPSRATITGNRVLVATGRYLGEGFDDDRLDTLFLTLPISWKGTISQYAGRLHRVHDMKKEVLIYDYADLQVPMLSRMFDRRLTGYRAIGYEIIE